jgi:hypothetical protein
MKKALKLTLLVIRSLIISTLIVGTFAKFPVPSTLGWMDLGWQYRKPVTVSNSGSTATNEDVLITIDTLALVNEGKLQSTCNDLRFTDSDENTTLSYWIESGCNTTSTKIWARIPSLTAGGKTIYMYYGNPTAVGTTQAWSGNVIMFADAACPTGWTRATTLDGKFLYGSATYGTTGGSNSHAHTDATATSSSISTTNIAGSTTAGTSGTTTTHTHTNLRATVNNNASVQPPFKDAILCYSNTFLFSQGLVSMFNTTTPSGWTRFSALDGVFPKANTTYGTTGGSATHTHTTTANVVTGAATGTQNTITVPFSATGGAVTYSGGYTIHTFTSSGTFTTNKAGSVEILVVGGGGGGSSAYDYFFAGGGGGGGGAVYSSAYAVASGGTGVTVGAGGAGNGWGQNGGNSVFSTITGYGGGGGGRFSNGAAGGSGGGGGGTGLNITQYSFYGGTGSQGYRGGNALGWGAAGGGGMGSAGGDVTEPHGTWGGYGIAYSISGSSVCYAGGGGGGALKVTYGEPGYGQCGGGWGGGGGGNGGYGLVPAEGVANSGSGGGGGCGWSDNYGYPIGTGAAGGSGVVIVRYPTPTITASGTIASSTHTHTSASATVSTDSNLPPYLDMVFAKANSDQYVTENNVIITSALPPLGWNRFTTLDSKFARGAATYGGTGGTATHTHSTTVTTGAPSATLTSYGTGANFANSTHTHSAAVTSDAVSNLPAYTTVIYAQRKISKTTVVGAENVQNSAPSAPSTPQTEGTANPTLVSDYTPEFSAIFTDIDGDNTGNYYQIQVNTNSSFTGTSMWDSTQTSLVPAVANGSRSQDISYAGTALQPGTTYYWRMKFWDNNTYQNVSNWSTTAQFTMNYVPTALNTDISGSEDIYAGKTLTIQAKYSDANGSADLDKLYLQIKNPAGTNIEYYITPTGSDQTGQFPTPVSGATYLSGITYDTAVGSPTANDVTVTWHVTPNWTWTRGTSIQYGVKVLDKNTAESTYSYTTSTYKYENRLNFAGNISATDVNTKILASGDWLSINSTVTFSGIKVVYEGTTSIYPLDSDFDVKIVNEESTEWQDLISSGEDITITTSTPAIQNIEDTYSVSIINIPTGGTDLSSKSFILKTDSTNPIISSFTSSTHPNQTIWYSSTTATLNWSIADGQSGIENIWYIWDNSVETDIVTTIASGTTITGDTITIANIQNGTAYLHLATRDNCGNTSFTSYTVNVDSSTPNIVDVTGFSNNTWQTTDDSPTISWTDPVSPSNDTFYITNDGTTPTSTNYTYTTTNNSYDLPAQSEGVTTIKVRALNGAGTYSLTRTFTMKYDKTIPAISSLTSTTHPNQNSWYTDTSATITWNSSDIQSGISEVWRLLDKTEIQSAENIMTSGTQATASGTYDADLTSDGIWYYHLLVIDNAGLVNTQTYKINIDTQNPVFGSVTSITHQVQTNWYSNSSAIINWTSSDTGSGILGVWKLLDQNETLTIAEVLADGTQSLANDTLATPELTDGIWYLHLAAKDNTNKTTYYKYTLKIDSSTVDIIAVTGANNGVLQNTESGPQISWTDPNSISEDIFFITNDGSIPNTSNYTYYTTSPSYDLPNQKEGETTIKVRALNGAGTYSETRSFVVKYDSIAPTNVSNFTATATQRTVALAWQNPTDTDFSKIILMRSNTHVPLSTTDGTKVYEGTLSAYSDTNLSVSTRYYYTIFALDNIENKSSGTLAQATTPAATIVPTQPTTPSEPEPEPVIPTVQPQNKTIKLQDLKEDQKIIVTTQEEKQLNTTDNGDIHTYANQTLNIEIPAKTITDNTTNLKNVIITVNNQTYNMTYDSEKNTYKTTIDSPSVKGTYATTIQAISNDDTSDLSITMALRVDPYGYVYTKDGTNELRILNAKVTLYTKDNSQEILWQSKDGTTNPQYTNQQGEYQFFVTPGEYKLVVETQGYMPTETEWFTVETNIVEKNIELKKTPFLWFEIIAGIEVLAGIGIAIFVKKRRKNSRNNV